MHKIVSGYSNQNFGVPSVGLKTAAGVVIFLPQTKSGAIDLTQMDRIGRGNSHDVYTLKEKPCAIVFKVNQKSMDLESSDRQKEYDSMRASYQELYAHFGDSCIKEELFLCDVSVNGLEKQAMVSVSEFERSFSAPSKRGLHAKDFHWDLLPITQYEEDYDGMLGALFFDDGEFKEKAIVEANPKLKDLFQLIDKESGFREAMADFLQKFQKYFEATGQFLDIIGKDNVIFFKNDLDQWDFKLGTVIKEETRDKLAGSLDLLKSDQDAFLADKKWGGPKFILNSTFTFMTALNTLGLKLGIGKIINDRNSQAIQKMWPSIEAIGLTQKQKDPALAKQLITVITSTSATKLTATLDQFSVPPQENSSIYLALLKAGSPEKQLALATYLHNKLPTTSDSIPPFKFCRARHMIAMHVKDIEGGKEIALGCLRDVLKDPGCPKDEVLRSISELE